ncbi:hypothetical protein [Candidatus Frankia alpina]|uniref:hypothetical protein n=1 Tax=Candidatus Frankia alpina TaxID=2699483 RepID=UPI0019678513|nr:hypothetical protein [Candidatus Frankia alpina]
MTQSPVLHCAGVALVRGGRALASGRADDVLTTERVSACFDHPIAVRREDGRWSARAPRRTG